MSELRGAEVLGYVKCPRCQNLKLRILKKEGRLFKFRCSQCGLKFYKYFTDEEIEKIKQSQPA